MEKKNLIKLIDDIVAPLNFKRKGNTWVNNGEQIVKIVNLQKSNYGNAFYINYGFIIPNLELTTTSHVEDRVSSDDKTKQEKITKILDLDSDIPARERSEGIELLIFQNIVPQILSIQTESDLLRLIKLRSTQNDIPLNVKRHFNLE